MATETPATKQRLKTQVFISYASEDALIANALEQAFLSLRGTDNPNLTIVRDIHSFEQGRALTTQVYDDLESSDILFIIYTERLKLSHSFTGMEAGAFDFQMNREIKRDGKTDKRTVTLYFDELPDTQKGMLGIKLDVSALDRRVDEQAAADIDPDGGLEKFLMELSDLAISRRHAAMAAANIEVDDLVAAKKAGRTKVRSEIVPRLMLSLTEAISSVVERNQIEQHFVHLQWGANPGYTVKQLEDETSLSVGSEEVYAIFGILPRRGKTTWLTFRNELTKKSPQNSQFVIEAIERAVQSAFDEGPVDNDQIFLSAKGELYRVIVTRYYVYYDGSRTMNMYLIPFLSNKLEADIDGALTLLRLSAHLRSKFLAEDSEFHPTRFDLFASDIEALKKQVKSAVKTMQVIASASHNVGMDDPANFERFFGKDPDMPNAAVAGLYADWKKQAAALLERAAVLLESSECDAIHKWKEALATFITFAEPINRKMGDRALDRITNWFAKGSLD